LLGHSQRQTNLAVKSIADIDTVNFGLNDLELCIKRQENVGSESKTKAKLCQEYNFFLLLLCWKT
jgi:hypothetical protein